MTYSPFFQTLHDGPRAARKMGCGPRYSVLRVPIWQDECLNPLTQGALLDFAVIWDEGHDDRVVGAIEEVYFGGLLAPVRFVGERHGNLSVLLAPRTIEAWGERKLREYAGAVSRIGQGLNEPWAVIVDEIFGRRHTLIEGAPDDVDTYLDDVILSWQLGQKSSLAHLGPSRQRRLVPRSLRTG